jgi:hypothetical protein
MIASTKKSVRFGELRVREFERAPLGEHPKAKGGFAMTLGLRYRDWAPMEIPNGPLQKRHDFYIDEQCRKVVWKRLMRFEQEFLNEGLCGRILRVGQKGSIDEQRWFEQQGRQHKDTPLLEQTMDEQRSFEYQKPFERLLEQRRSQKCQNEVAWNRRKARLIDQWRCEQTLLHSRMKPYEQKREMELERIRRLEEQQELERQRQRSFLAIAVATLIIAFVLCLLDPLFAMFSLNGNVQLCRAFLSVYVDCCMYLCKSACLCVFAFVLCERCASFL